MDSQSYIDEKDRNNILSEAEKDIYYASQWKLMWWSFKKHKIALVSAIIIILMYIIAIFAGFFAPYEPGQRDVDSILAPPQLLRFIDKDGNFSICPFTYAYEYEFDLNEMKRKYQLDTGEKYPIYFFVRGSEYRFLFFKTDLHLFGTDEGKRIYLFGTDNMGRDILSRIIYGGRISMSIGLVGVFLSLLLGLLLGGVSGYFGGTIDNIVQRIIEIIRSFPTIPLWMALSAAIPPGISPIHEYLAITIILSFTGWTTMGRQIRGMVMSLKNEDFVIAARLAGTSETKIVTNHLLPSFMSHIIARLTLSIPSMILSETSLSYLGIGLTAPVISWGVMLQSAQNVQTIALSPWLLIPGLFVIIYVLCFNFLGDGLRDAADPYNV